MSVQRLSIVRRRSVCRDQLPRPFVPATEQVPGARAETAWRERPTAAAAIRTTVRLPAYAPAAEIARAAEPTQRDCEQEALAAKPIAERRRERSDHGRREQAGESGNSDSGRATAVIGEDTEGDEVRPLGCDRGAPGELGTPDVVVAGRDAECVDHHDGGGSRVQSTPRPGHGTRAVRDRYFPLALATGGSAAHRGGRRGFCCCRRSAWRRIWRFAVSGTPPCSCAALEVRAALGGSQAAHRLLHRLRVGIR